MLSRLKHVIISRENNIRIVFKKINNAYSMNISENVILNIF